MKAWHARWLDAAGIAEPELRAAYERCRVLHARFGRSYYLATLLLPPEKRPYVSSLYGFARHADEIVDNGDPLTKAQTLTGWCESALADLRRGQSTDPICRAVLHTMAVWNIGVEHFEAFAASMLMDLSVCAYPTFADLRTYMYGSAAVIGLQMTPILVPSRPEAAEHAKELGEAFQLTNFIRDVAEDLRLGRIYLPMEDLDAFGVTRQALQAGITTPRVRELIRYEIHRTRLIYAQARPGIAMLAPSSQECIGAAFALYSGILDEVERADYQVLDRRVSMSIARRLRIAVPAYRRARRLWRGPGASGRQAREQHQVAA
jgi:15-cis-phytoene synthase